MKLKKLIGLQVSCEAGAESFRGVNMSAYTAMMSAAEEIKKVRQLVTDERIKRLAPPPRPNSTTTVTL